MIFFCVLGPLEESVPSFLVEVLEEARPLGVPVPVLTTMSSPSVECGTLRTVWTFSEEKGFCSASGPLIFLLGLRQQKRLTPDEPSERQ